MLESLRVGLSEGAGERLNRSYAYNYFGDITALTEDTNTNPDSFTYDGLGRLTSAYGRTYSYDRASRLTAFNGQSYGYGDGGPYHAVDRIDNVDRFDYDANGNMTARNKGLASQQTLVWDAQNRLSEVRDNNGDMLESYWYDAAGGRVKTVSGSTTTYTFFGHYEEEVSSGVTTAISHYSLGSLRIAVKRGSTLYHLHGDHLGSTSVTTAGSEVEGSRAYYPYGAQRSASGTLRTDRTFTGQKEDGTGLLYYNARYYDPALGTFISPDSLVPDAGMVVDYNRYLYARGNPLKYSDPSGYASAEWEAMNNWYNARGWFHNPSSRHWDIRGKSQVSNRAGAIQILHAAGIELDNPFSWSTDKLKLLALGIARFGERLEEDFKGRLTVSGIEYINSLIKGDIIWRRKPTPADSERPEGCNFNDPIACAWPDGFVEWYDSFFNSTISDAGVMALGVHEISTQNPFRSRFNQRLSPKLRSLRQHPSKGKSVLSKWIYAYKLCRDLVCGILG